MKSVINTKNAPSPIGPYSQAVRAGNTLFVSGQIAIHPESNELLIENLEQETHQVMKNLVSVVEAAGFTMHDVVKCGIFLSDMDTFSVVNEIYGSYFSGTFPARETVQVSKLPMGVNVEISAIAVRD